MNTKWALGANMLLEGLSELGYELAAGFSPNQVGWRCRQRADMRPGSRRGSAAAARRAGMALLVLLQRNQQHAAWPAHKPP